MTPFWELANYTYNPQALPPIVTGIALLLLGSSVLFQERFSKVSISFCVVTLVVAAWLIPFGIMRSATNSSVALGWAKAGHLGLPLIPVAVFHFTTVVLKQDTDHLALIWINWLLGIFFVIGSICTNFVIVGMYHYWWGYYPQYGQINILFIPLFSTLLTSSLYKFRNAYHKATPGVHRKRLRALTIAFIIGDLSMTDFLAAFGIPLIPIGHLTIFLFMVLTARAIRRYRLADITPSFVATKLMTTMNDALIVCDAAQTIQLVNKAFCDTFGYLSPEVIGQPILALAADSAQARSTLQLALRRVSVRDEETQFRTRNGKIIDISLSITQLLEGHHITGSVVVARDIRERKRAEIALHDSEERYALAARGANDGLWDWNLTQDCIYYSPRWKAMLGWDDRANRDETCPEAWFSRVHEDDRTLLREAIQTHLEGKAYHLENEHRILHQDGSYRWVLCRGLAVRDEAGTATRIAGSLTDITERKRTEAQLLYDALHDHLTGLPNRALFMDRLGHLFLQQERTATEYAVLFLDFDRFKLVNDSLGHSVGDHLLIAITQRVAGCLRPSDTIARFGGDEFAILLEGVEQVSDAGRVADRIQATLQEPFMVQGHEIFTSASIGIAMSTIQYNRPEELLRDADIAMYRAKGLGRARYHVFDPTMHAETAAQLQLETDLRRAIERHEFELHYQPIVALDHNRLTGFEALVRWQRTEDHLVSPAQFIPLAEETGLIVPLGNWILSEACRQMAQWQQQFPSDQPLTISVNLSGRQLVQPDLPEIVSDALRESGLSAASLKLEITESSLVENTDAAAETLQALRALGIQLQMDDFGTGYSSLNYLHRFPINSLKIDRSFISGMHEDSDNAAIVETIITLAHALGLYVVAEGVETEEQLNHLKPLRCEYGQGYLFARPLPRATAEALIVESLTLTTDTAR